MLLLLRAFASGSTAMTGIEAISNAVPAFQPVEWRNARTTLTWMVGLLIALFAGTIALVHFDGVVPNAHETVLSQLAHRSFGSGFMYAFTQAATAAILLLAANTAYNDFPRVLFLLARDQYAPRLFLRMGDRLAFSNGIILLSVAATVIYVAFGGQTDPLIPLFAVGVFLAFTLSQAGMVVHWWRRRDAHWRKSLFFNATGCLLSAIVFITAGSRSSPQVPGLPCSRSGCSCWSRCAFGTTTTWPLRRSHCRQVRVRCHNTRSRRAQARAQFWPKPRKRLRRSTTW